MPYSPNPCAVVGAVYPNLLSAEIVEVFTPGVGWVTVAKKQPLSRRSVRAWKRLGVTQIHISARFLGVDFTPNTRAFTVKELLGPLPPKRHWLVFWTRPEWQERDPTFRGAEADHFGQRSGWEAIRRHRRLFPEDMILSVSPGVTLPPPPPEINPFL